MKKTAGRTAKKTAGKTAGKTAKKTAGKTTKKTSKDQKAPEVAPRFVPVVATFARDRNVTRKRMFSSDNVLTVNGKIFAMLVKDELVVKLPKERVDELVSAHLGENFDPGHGRIMKEWVAVGPGRADWVELAKEAHRFVGRAG